MGMLSMALVLCACSTPGASSRNEEAVDEGTRADDEATSGLPQGFDLQGHRGARGLRPENTLPAFEKALDLRVDTLELDLHLSSDGKLVVWHDAFLYRSKCRVTQEASGRIATTTETEKAKPARVRGASAETLRTLQCAKNPDPERFPKQRPADGELAGGDYGIVTLPELFDFVARYAESDLKSAAQRANARDVQFNVETKRHPEHPYYIDDGFDGTTPGKLERRLVEVIQQRGLGDRVIVQSFDRRSLWAIHRLAPDLRLAVLEAKRHEPLTAYAKRGADVWSPAAGLVDETSLAEARDAGLSVIPWTVNEPDEMRRLIELGVDGLITDRPDLEQAETHSNEETR